MTRHRGGMGEKNRERQREGDIDTRKRNTWAVSLRRSIKKQKPSKSTGGGSPSPAPRPLHSNIIRATCRQPKHQNKKLFHRYPHVDTDMALLRLVLIPRWSRYIRCRPRPLHSNIILVTCPNRQETESWRGARERYTDIALAKASIRFPDPQTIPLQHDPSLARISG